MRGRKVKGRIKKMKEMDGKRKGWNKLTGENKGRSGKRVVNRGSIS